MITSFICLLLIQFSQVDSTFWLGLIYWLYISSAGFNMYTALQKIHKDKDAEPTEFEENVAQVFIKIDVTLLVSMQQ